MGTARWSSNERSPWQAFAAVSVGVHLAAIGLAALVLAWLHDVDEGARPRARARAPVAVELLAPNPPPTPVRPPVLPLVPGTYLHADDVLAAELREPIGLVRPPVELEALQAPRVSLRAGVSGAPRTPSGGPARTLVTMTLDDAELMAGPGDGTGSTAAVPGEPGPEPGGSEVPPLILGPAGSPLTVSLGSADPRFADYLGMIAALLEPEWRNAFPRERALYMQQGEIVIEWMIERGGAVERLRVLRPSGVPPFDRNVLAGFRRAAARFPPPPTTMPLPILIRAPYRFENPMFD